MLNKEFLTYIDNDLSRPFIEGGGLYDKEKLTSLLFAILRIKNTIFVDLFKEEINIYLKSTIKQTVIEYVAQLDDDHNEENSFRFVLMFKIRPDAVFNQAGIKSDKFFIYFFSLIERVRSLGFQEFLHILSRILNNVKIMLGRIKVIETTIAIQLSFALKVVFLGLVDLRSYVQNSWFDCW